MRILIAAGGTGGHIYPALAVTTQLAIRRPDLELRWMGGHRGLEADVVVSAGIRLDRLWLRSLRTVDASVHSVLDPLRLLASVPQALVGLLRWRPDAVYATGGYVAIPVVAAAALLGIPTLLWEGNRVPGRSVRLSGRLATVRAVSYAATLRRLPVPTFLTGTPIRDLDGIDRAEAARRLGIPPGLPIMLVFGGSQSVRRFEEAMTAALGDLVERCAVVHVTGPASFAQAERLRDALPVEHRGRYRPFPFLHEDMVAAWRVADLLVARAGSSTLAEAAAAGLPVVVVPYPHAAAHQRANAAEMVEAGAAILVDDADLDGDALREACDLLFEDRLAGMAAAARSLGRPGAAGATAELLLSLAEGAPLPDPAALDGWARPAA
jgi:UDP-N-acetylglucosamine--N-acetylmuramyl-(pentapeptide) pyrophosphoryl-undecaprenol N-acetylglucosamine transferase